MDFSNKFECLPLASHSKSLFQKSTLEWSKRKAPSLPANIRLGWKGWAGTNAPTYYKISKLWP